MNNQKGVDRNNSLSGFAHILPLILVVVLFGVSGRWMWSNDKLNITVESPTPTSTQQETLSPNSENNIPENWKSYNGENYSFSYPTDWEIQNNINTPNITLEEQLIIINPEGSVGIFITKYRPEFGVGGPNNPVQKNQVNVATEDNIYRADEMTVESKSLGFLITELDNGYTVTAGSHGIIPGVQNEISYDKYLEHKETILKILSTFEFVE